MKKEVIIYPKLNIIDKLIFLVLLAFISNIIIFLCVSILISKNETTLFSFIFFFEYCYLFYLTPINKFIINLLNPDLKYNIFKLYCRLSFKPYNIKLYIVTIILCITISIILLLNIKHEFITEIQYFILLYLLFSSYFIRYFYLLGYIIDFLMNENCFHIYVNKKTPKFNIKEYDFIKENQLISKYILSEDYIIKGSFHFMDKNKKYIFYEPNLGSYNISEPLITKVIDIIILLFLLFFGLKFYLYNIDWVSNLAYEHIANNTYKKVVNIEMLIRRWYVLFIALFNCLFFIYIYFFQKNIISLKYLKLVFSKKFLNILLHIYIKTLIKKTGYKYHLFFSIVSLANYILINLALIIQTKFFLFLALFFTLFNSLRIFWLIPQQLYQLNIRSLYKDLLNIDLPDPKLFSEGICKDNNFYHIRYDVKSNEYCWAYNSYITQEQLTIDNVCSFFQLIFTLIFIPYFYYIGLIFINNLKANIT